MSYRIHKGPGEDMEFKGLKAQFLVYMGGLMLGVIVLFIILNAFGSPAILSGFISVGLLTFLGSKIYALNREMGKDGMMKKAAFLRLPFAIRIRDRGPILALRKRKSGLN